MQKPHLSKQVIQNFLEGKTTQMQNILIQNWLENPVHRELYFQWIDEWEAENLQFTPDVEQAFQRSVSDYNKVVDTISGNSSPLQSNSKPTEQRYLFMRWTAVAAGILTVLGYSLSEEIRYKKYETSYGEIRTIILPDSSRVTLNANSVLRIPRFGFGKGTRQVRLEGEAGFEVRHTIDRNKFIVRTPDQLEIKVLGTEFLVYSRERGSKVVLTRGSVQLRSLSQPTPEPLILKPGDVATLTKGKLSSFKHNESISTHLAWKQRRFMFENTAVSEITFQISEHFGVNVIVADSALSKRTIGGTFHASDPAHVLKVLGDVLNAHVTRIYNDGSETYILQSIQ